MHIEHYVDTFLGYQNSTVNFAQIFEIDVAHNHIGLCNIRQADLTYYIQNKLKIIKISNIL